MSSTKELPAIWIQGAGCSGCSVSVLNGVAPDIAAALLDEIVPGKHLNLRFHPTVMAGAGEPAVKILEDTPRDLEGGYVLVVEGGVQVAEDGAFCHVGERDGHGIPFTDHVEKLASKAMAVIALGDCAAFGGVPSVAPNPTGSVGVSKFLASRDVKTPVVNIGGCPPNPDWFLGTVAHVLLRGLPAAEALDPWGRPRLFYGRPVHDNCQRRACEEARRRGVSLSPGMQGADDIRRLPGPALERGHELVRRRGRAVHGLRGGALLRQVRPGLREGHRREAGEAS